MGTRIPVKDRQREKHHRLKVLSIVFGNRTTPEGAVNCDGWAVIP